jgi:hypothetical protein
MANMNDIPLDAQEILDCLKQVAVETLERKRRLGHYAVIWQDGRPVAIGEDAPAHLASPPSERFALKLRYESNDSTKEIRMIDSEILEKLQGASIEERILVIEAILRTVKNDMRATSSHQISSEHRPLQGKVVHYEDPYEPVATEDWEALA